MNILTKLKLRLIHKHDKYPCAPKKDAKKTGETKKEQKKFEKSFD